MADITTTRTDGLSEAMENDEEFNDPEIAYEFSNGRKFQEPDDPYA